MAAKKKKVAVKRPAFRRRGTPKTGFMTEVEQVLGAVAGGIIVNMIAKQLPVATTPNGEKMKSAAIFAAGVFVSAKTKNPMLKTVAGGVAVGGGMQLVKHFVPTLLAGDDLLGYTQALGDVEEARIYAGLGHVQGLHGDDLLGTDLLGTDLLGDDLLGDEIYGDNFDLAGDDLLGLSSQGVSF